MSIPLFHRTLRGYKRGSNSPIYIGYLDHRHKSPPVEMTKRPNSHFVLAFSYGLCLLFYVANPAFSSQHGILANIMEKEGRGDKANV